MSIQDQLKALEAAKLVVKYLPRNPHSKAKRRLYLGAQAIKDIGDPSSATNLLVGKAHIINAMERWVLGERIYGKKRGEFLCRLDPPPPEVWEIRVTAPRPQARLFGRFAEPDTLILTGFHTRPHLGDRGSEAWKQAMSACCDAWTALFPETAALTGNSIADFVTENCDVFPL